MSFALALMLVVAPVVTPPGMDADDSADTLVPEGKLVLAHYMTKMVPGSAGERLWASPELYDPEGSTAALGGLYLTLPMWTSLRKDVSLEEGVEFEIRTARQMGVDGFQFYYPFFQTSAPLRDYNRIVSEFLRVADSRYPGFKVTLCLSLGGRFPEMSETQRVDTWGTPLKELLDKTAASPAWLRTRSGSFLFYHWVTDGFADGVHHRANNPAQVEKVAAAFQRLAQHTGHEIDWVFHLRRTEIDPPYIDAVLRHFSAVWGWVDSEDKPEFWDHCARQCRKQGVAYTQTVYPDYFTSKVYALEDRRYRILTAKEALKIGIDGVERHYRQTDLAKVQVQLLQAAIDRKAQLINYATWNDWPEGHHLAPEVNHNFGPSLLLRHSAAKWRGRPSPFRDLAIVFFKKHPSTAVPKHTIAVRVKSVRNEPTAEDEVQLVTILQNPARCLFNGEDIGSIDAGFKITSVSLPDDGRVHVRLLRGDNSHAVVDLAVPVGITRSPGRTDRLTYSYSNRFSQEFHAVFGNDAKPSSAE